MVRAHRAYRGFTLVELLVVIGIIAVLAAIIVPVFGISRRKAAEAKAIGHMQQIAVALKQFRQEKGYYPPPPVFNSVDGRYEGGLSDLYPDYIDDPGTLICSVDDVNDIDMSTIPEGYCSYNGIPMSPGTGNWNLDPNQITYNCYGLSDGTPACGGIPPGFDVGAVNQGTRSNPQAGWAGQWDAAMPAGAPSRKMPRLLNRYAPDNTIAFHCVHFPGDDVIVARLGGEVEKISTDADPTDLWILQK